MAAFTISPVTTKAERGQWVDHVYTANAGDPNFVPQLRAEELEKVTPAAIPSMNMPACSCFWPRTATASSAASARISTSWRWPPRRAGHGAGHGQLGALEAETQEIANALIGTAEDWLRGQG
jgi:hypothetical protein